MPSWNIHTAHVERLFERHRPHDLGIDDANAFLFGNYVPDIYVGFMIPETTFRINYCITHIADPNLIPIPDADRFWDDYLARRLPSDPSCLSLTLGAWAHLVADRIYNGRFRTFWETHDTPEGEQLRIAKQGDFDLFGCSLGIESRVTPTPELLAAGQAFRPYSVLADEIHRTIEVMERIFAKNAPDDKDAYQLLNREWMETTFDACEDRLAIWLGTWQDLVRRGCAVSASRIREEAGLPPAL